jgi:anaerobic selenocysteine-containing dehydrogenase
VEGELAAAPRITVAEGDPNSEARLQVGDNDMMSALDVLAGALDEPPEDQMVLISRRETHVVNSAYNAMAARGGRRHNPLYVNPSDLQRLGVEPGDKVRIASARASVSAIAAADDSIRPGVAAMSHAFGSAFPEQDDPGAFGSSTARLCDVEDDYDPYSGQPRMSGISVTISPLALAPEMRFPDLVSDVAD